MEKNMNFQLKAFYKNNSNDNKTPALMGGESWSIMKDFSVL